MIEFGLESVKVHEVFFIHKNTKPIKIEDRYVQLATDYVVARGYKFGYEDEIYSDKEMNCELTNFIPGLWWNTYEEGEKQLAKLMSCLISNYNGEMRDTFDRLKSKYPEYMV